MTAWALVGVAFLLRLPGIGKGLRSDEIGNLLYSAGPAGEIIEKIVESDAHPPLSYFIYHLWLAAGTSEAWIRLLTVILGTALCGLGFEIARRRLDQRTSLIALWLLAVAPASILLSQTMRSYMFAAVFVASAVLCFTRLQDAGEPPRWPQLALYGVWGVLALYSFYLALLPLAILWGYAVWSWRTNGTALLRWNALHLAIAIVYVPWLPMLMRQFGRVNEFLTILPGFFVGPVHVGGLVRALAGAVGVDDALFLEQGLAIALPRPMLGLIAVVVVTVAVALVVWGWRALAARDAAFAALVLSLAIGPFVLAAAAQLASGFVLLQRHLFTSVVFAAFLVAAPIARLRSPVLRTAVLLALSIVCLGRDVQLYTWHEVDWKGAAAYVARHRQSGDRIVYVRDPRARYYMPVDMEMIDGASLFVSRVGESRVNAAAADRLVDHRIWLTLTETFLLRPRNDAIAQWLETRGVSATETRHFGGLRVTLYGPSRREATR